MSGAGFDPEAYALVIAGIIRDVLSERVPGLITAAVAPLSERIEALEDAMTSQRQLSYRGVFADGADYRPGEFCTFAGSLWHCNAATTARPGSDASAWTLAVKRGRDAKGAARGTPADA